MNNSLIIGIVAAVVVLGGAFFLFNNSGSSGGENGAMNKDEAPEDFSGNLSGLLAFGKNITCTFSHEEGGATAEGTVYVEGRGEKVRADFTMLQGGESFSASTISRDGTNYSWGETPFGSFATMVKDDDSGTSDGKNQSQGFDLETDVDYKCSTWRVDSSKFELPAGVQFQDINAQVGQIDAAMEQVGDLKCSACDQIPDAASKAQCKAALGC